MSSKRVGHIRWRQRGCAADAGFLAQTVELIQPNLSTLLALVEHILPKYGHFVKRLDFTGDSATRRDVEEMVNFFRSLPTSFVGDFETRRIPTERVDALGEARHAIQWTMVNPTYLYRAVLIAAGLRSVAISQCPSVVAIRILNADEFFTVPLLRMQHVSIYHDQYRPSVVNLQYPPFQALLKLGQSIRHIEIMAADAPQHLALIIALRSACPALEVLSIGGGFLRAPGDDVEVLVDTPVLRLTGSEPMQHSVFNLDLFYRILGRPFRQLEISAPFVRFTELQAFFSLQADNITDLRLLNVPDIEFPNTAARFVLPNLRKLFLAIVNCGRLDLGWFHVFESSPVEELSLDCRLSNEHGLADVVVDAACHFSTTLKTLSLRCHSFATAEAARIGAWCAPLQIEFRSTLDEP